MVLVAVALTASTSFNAYKRWRQPATEPWDTVVTDWRSYAVGGHRIGPASAPVTLVLFSDYECPVCTRIDRELRALRDDNPSSLGIVVRHFPLQFHSNARAAAVAAECAADQNRFVAYHEGLFDHPEMLSRKQWVLLAARANVPDTTAFGRCLREQRASLAVDADVAAGKRLGVFGTPTVLLEEEEYVGIPRDFRAIVERHIKQARPSR